MTVVADRLLETVPRLMRRIRRAMRAEVTGDPTMTVPQLRALLYVRRHPGRSLSALAEQLGMTLPACSMLAERLVRAGRLERTVDPAERRRVQLRLTRDGVEDVARAQRQARAWLTRGLAGLPAADLVRLEAALELLDGVTAADDEAPR